MSLRTSLRAWHCTLAASIVMLLGCNREHYRTQADREVQYLVEQKSIDPRWALPGFNINVDPRSRYFDIYAPDTTPMPPDDPASHRFMHVVDGKRGWPHWHQWGDRRRLANPQWREQLAQYVPITEEGDVRLSLESAMRLAYVHSPDHQQQLETIYLSALDVSTERFRLQTQFFGGNDTFYQHDGRLHPGGERNILTTDTDFQVRRRFATAGELLVNFANSFVWQFAGPDTNFATSLVNFNLIQPLLRGAGRDIALEQLTIVERGLLSNLRAYQRWRHGFWTEIAIGESGAAGPQRRGGFFGGTGLTGFSGQGAGGLGGVGAATGFGRGTFTGGGGGGGGTTGFAGGGAGTVGGFIGLLQQLQEIRNTEVSLESQIRTLALLEANLEAGFIDLTQVDQFRQSIETERATLLQARNGLENAVENYLTSTLGLPPDLEVELDDTLIRQFQFIDARTVEAQSALEDLQDAMGEFSEDPSMELAVDLLEQARAGLEQVEAVSDTILADLAVLDERIPLRMAQMSPGEQRSFAREMQMLQVAMTELMDRLAQKDPTLQQIRDNLTAETRRQTLDQLVVWLRDLLTLAQEISLIQARARVESIVLEPVGIDSADAFRLACRYRLDLMNNRAALVDSWRLIQFNADALQSDLDIVFSGDMTTVGDNPVNFRAPTGTLRAGVQFDAPFQRLLERNNYRQSLIDYQQDRRQLIQFYDNTYRSLRQLLRVMEQLELNMEIQRRAVVIAIRRVDLTREDLNEPTAPPEPGQPATQLGPTAAVNLLTALSDLRSTQNNFMSVWLNYYANRMRLHRDTGLMQLTDEGIWIDVPIFATEEYEEALEEGADDQSEVIPPPLPEEWIREAFEGLPEDEWPKPDSREDVPVWTVSHQEPAQEE